VELDAENFSAVQGLSTIKVKPVGGYLYNGTLYVFHDDPGAKVKVYSDVGI